METDQRMIKESWIGLALQDYKEGLGAFEEQSPQLVEGFNDFTEICFQAGELDAKMKQLIAMAIGVFSNNEYCTIYHVKGAMDQGASVAEILETVGVATALGGGTAMAQGATLVQDTIQELQLEKEQGNVH